MRPPQPGSTRAQNYRRDRDAATLGSTTACTVMDQQGKATADFAFTDYSGKEFIFRLTHEQRIAEARRILSGEETMSTHVMGKIRKTKVDYNPDWDFHLDPDAITFFTMAIEVCDASINYVNDYLDEACGAFLPGCFWCPWSSRLTRELR